MCKDQESIPSSATYTSKYKMIVFIFFSFCQLNLHLKMKHIDAVDFVFRGKKSINMHLIYNNDSYFFLTDIEFP